MLSKFGMDNEAFTHWHYIPIIEELYNALKKIDYEDDYILGVTFWCYQLAKRMEQEYIVASNQGYKSLQLHEFAYRQTDIIQIMDLLEMARQKVLCPEFDEVYMLLKEIEHKEEIFHEVATVVYYCLRAKLKYGFEQKRLVK